MEDNTGELFSKPPHPESEPTSKNKAEIAEKFFVDASIRYSGLTPAQCADLALKCKEGNYDPLELRDALLEESGKTEELTGLANRMHAKHRKKPPSGLWQRMFKAIRDFTQAPEEPREITEQEMINTINGNFSTASKMMSADRATLEEIISWYPEYKNKKRHHRERNDAYADRLESLLPHLKEADQLPQRRQKNLTRRPLVGKVE